MSPEYFSILRAAQPGEPVADKFSCQKVISSLLHLAQCTRLDTALPVMALAACASAPSEAHFEAMLDVFHCVGSVKTLQVDAATHLHNSLSLATVQPSSAGLMPIGMPVQAFLSHLGPSQPPHVSYCDPNQLTHACTLNMHDLQQSGRSCLAFTRSNQHKRHTVTQTNYVMHVPA
jgi:hypothetical protein